MPLFVKLVLGAILFATAFASGAEGVSSQAGLTAAAAGQPPEQSQTFTLWTGSVIPDNVRKIADVPGVEHRTIHRATPDGYKFLHGASIVHHRGVFYANWANSPTNENGPHETLQGRRSVDGGRTWSGVEVIGPGFDGPERHSHGVLFVHDGSVWTICSRFGVGVPGRRFPGLKAEAFVLDERTDRWESKGVVMENCWPYDQPMRMENGNWITGGQDKDGLPVVALSHGDDLTRWDSILIPYPADLAPSFAETTVWAEARRVLAVIRGGGGVAWVSTSDDYGRNWSEAQRSNLPMPRAKAYLGKLTTGQLFLVSNLKDRDTLVISVGRPGEDTLSRMWRIRHGKSVPPRFSGHAKGKQWSYPYAYEHEGKLFVVYSVGKEDCGLSVMPVQSLQVPPRNSHRQPTVASSDGDGAPQEALLGQWSFEECERGLVRDVSGAGRVGKLVGKPVLGDGARGRCLRLPGPQDYVTVQNSEELDFSDAAFSVTAWVNVYALRGDQQMIVAKNDYSANQREWGLMVDGDSRFRFYLRSGDRWRTVDSKTVPELGHWYQVGVTLDAGHARLYVNGKLEGEAELGQPIPQTAAPLTIGAVNDGGRVRQALFGAIDEVRLYSRALSPDEVAARHVPVSATHAIPAEPCFTLWDPEKPVPKASECPLLEGVEFVVVKPREPEADGYNWLHGAAVCWHDDKLYASFGHNEGHENTASEVAHGRMSTDGGKTWGPVFPIDDDDPSNPAVSHGVFLSRRRELWAFHGSFYDKMQNVHTRAYRLEEQSGRWEPRGIVAENGFWPMQEPVKMDDGNWIIAGISVDGGSGGADPAAVAISRADDLTEWDVVKIPPDPRVGRLWGESTVIVDGSQVLNISRWGRPVALASLSNDYGRTWTPMIPSNLPMAASKPYAGVLSNGQRYLVGTTTADSGNSRHPLTIAVGKPGAKAFSRIFRIRDAVYNGPGESAENCRLSYPYAVEHDGSLYVAYSVDGGRGGNRNSAELAIIPVEKLHLP